MRPLSIDELTSASKPRFIKKSERVVKTQAKIVAPKRKIHHEEEAADTQIKQNKVKKNRFNFDWDEQDDTSNGSAPLLELDTYDDPLVSRSLHWSEKPLREMKDSDWRSMKDEFNIITKGTKTPPIRSWKESSINSRIVETIQSLKFKEPTPIQRASIPIALENRDIIGIAETGSGKTLSYIIPLLNYILSIDETYMKYESQQDFNLNKPLGLILAPTRELANQIQTELQKFCKFLNLKSISIIGGHSYEETVSSLKEGVHIIIATPGRLVDSLERKIINLSKCYYVIFDEADRMIDMGFEASLKTIYDHLPEMNEVDKQTFKLQKRLTMMFTATFSSSIESLTKQYLDKPVQLVIGKIGEKVDNINQEFDYLQAKDIDKKFDKLVKVIERHASRNKKYSIIIFANFIKTVEELSEYLTEKGLDNITIHGSKSQQARERSIDEFKKGNKRILVATDVAARGIDIANVSLVINYQMTKKIDEYIHRIGRTGRAGTKDLRKFLKKNLPSFLMDYQSQSIRD